jgi:hypothetical protein
MQPSVSDVSVNCDYQDEGLSRLLDPCAPNCRGGRTGAFRYELVGLRSCLASLQHVCRVVRGR